MFHVLGIRGLIIFMAVLDVAPGAFQCDAEMCDVSIQRRRACDTRLSL